MSMQAAYAREFQRRKKAAGVLSRALKSRTVPKTSFRRMQGVLSSRGFRPIGRRNAKELKVADALANAERVSTTGLYRLLNVPVLGTDFSNRIGRKILVKSLYIRGFVTSTAAANLTANANAPPQQARLIIVWDMQPNGVTFGGADLLTSLAPQAMLNLNNRDRFKIVSDTTYEIGVYRDSNVATASIATTGQVIHPISKYIKLGKIETVFNAGSAGVIADINSGALFAVWVGSNAAGANDATAFVSYRARFQDL